MIRHGTHVAQSSSKRMLGSGSTVANLPVICLPDMAVEAGENEDG